MQCFQRIYYVDEIGNAFNKLIRNVQFNKNLAVDIIHIKEENRKPIPSMIHIFHFWKTRILMEFLLFCPKYKALNFCNKSINE